MNEERIRKKDVKAKLMENAQEEHLGQDGNNSLGNVSQRKVEEDGRSKLKRRRVFAETKTDDGA